MAALFLDLDEELKKLSDPVRAKNLQILIDDLSLVYEIANVRV